MPHSWPCLQRSKASGFTGATRLRGRHPPVVACAGKNEVSLQSTITKTIIDQYLPLGLICAIALGYSAPALGTFANQAGMSVLATKGIFFLSGLSLKPKDVAAAASAWSAFIYCAIFILIFSPAAVTYHPPSLPGALANPQTCCCVASLTPAGALANPQTCCCVASLTPAGALANLRTCCCVASLTPAGALANPQTCCCVASLTPAGALANPQTCCCFASPRTWAAMGAVGS
ncbi:hypothetical protein CYMTET_28546 [Cymbomonas tetramitiformis]|uniref:Uncharacterized protein n=1 Tax=Cymbomonas tetramitiformis TaxID=36881 RepID=A0AAE0KVU3_9CHLO|nr:hypothetical protein CYMTET_28546 [Cymbomonas tetramitiformis]